MLLCFLFWLMFYINTNSMLQFGFWFLLVSFSENGMASVNFPNYTNCYFNFYMFKPPNRNSFITFFPHVMKTTTKLILRNKFILYYPRLFQSCFQIYINVLVKPSKQLTAVFTRLLINHYVPVYVGLGAILKAYHVHFFQGLVLDVSI